MKTVTAREANQKFSQLLASVDKGEEVVITRRGVPVARLVPEVAAKGDERAQARRELMEMLRKGVPLGGVRANRDEIYDR